MYPKKAVEEGAGGARVRGVDSNTQSNGNLTQEEAQDDILSNALLEAEGLQNIQPAYWVASAQSTRRVVAPPNRPRSAAVSRDLGADQGGGDQYGLVGMLKKGRERPGSASYTRSNLTLARCVSRQFSEQSHGLASSSNTRSPPRPSSAFTNSSRPQSALSSRHPNTITPSNVGMWSADGHYFGTGDRRAMKVANFNTMSPRAPLVVPMHVGSSESAGWSTVASPDGAQVHAGGDRHVRGVSMAKCLPRPPPKVDARGELKGRCMDSAVSRRVPTVRMDGHSTRVQDAYSKGQGPPPTVVQTASVVSAAVARGRVTVRSAAEEEYLGELLVDDADRRYVLGDKEEARVRARRAVRQQHRYRPFIISEYKDADRGPRTLGHVNFASPRYVPPTTSAGKKHQHSTPPHAPSVVSFNDLHQEGKMGAGWPPGRLWCH